MTRSPTVGTSQATAIRKMTTERMMRPAVMGWRSIGDVHLPASCLRIRRTWTYMSGASVTSMKIATALP